MGCVARITLNRLRHRNAQSTALLDELDAAFSKAERDSGVRVIVPAAEGDSFSAGHDLGTPDERADPSSIFKQQGLEAIHLRSRQMFLDYCLRWRDLPKPTIA